MFGTNDPHSLSSDLPDLISFLDTRFAEDQLPGDTFKSFATRYLEENRPSEVFAVDNNYGILLTNGQRVKLCPDAPGNIPTQTGDMANPGQEIDITRRG
jgi:hypothetical protein